MGGRIDFYYDIASWYSYVGFADLFMNLDILAAHGVQVEFHPVSLGGIMKAAANQPPMMNPLKGEYLGRDGSRAAARVGKSNMRFPPDFFSRSKTLIPQRALHYIKKNYPTETYLTALHYLLDSYFTPPHPNVSKPDGLARALAQCPRGFKGSAAGEDYSAAGKLFSAEEVKAIMEGTETPEMKEALKATTEVAIRKRAFGAPWLVVTNSEGREEVFFGSDRFGFIYEFLGLPYHDVELLPPRSKGKL
ncbi:hypothetical protein jhhlp_006927 [Lomentospora prolificans]|uniref:DSBA-like thioredoxin domain-containing protein n=1 Tax=Lomentospora prolificans TaxID=41688 RepID=A0A2N3N343_9PEZI|nr:hypothetical protein jhhlp_006927 [Lomentospora prolificans]